MRTLPMAAAALAISLALATSSRAVTVTSFDSFTPTSPYGSWTTGTLTSGATAFEVQATGFGGSYCDLPNVNGAGTDTVQLSTTVNAGTAGFILALGDTAGHEYNYAWYGNPVGTYTLTMPIATPTFRTNVMTGTLDLANLDYIHIQVDPGAFAAVPYDVSYNDLQVIATPEPATLASLALLGGCGLRRRRRGQR